MGKAKRPAAEQASARSGDATPTRKGRAEDAAREELSNDAHESIVEDAVEDAADDIGADAAEGEREASSIDVEEATEANVAVEVRQQESLEHEARYERGAGLGATSGIGATNEGVKG